MTTDTAQAAEMQAALLSNALPYMQRYENKTVVVKYGGHAMGNIELGRAFARDIALLKQSGVNPIVVHGGGPQIGAMLAKMGIESKFEGGLRVTDQRTVEIVEMVLAGSINKEIVALINAEGEWAIGLCGKDGNMVFAEKAKKTVVDPDSNIERVLDLGFVGEPVEVDRTLLDLLARSEMIPVIAPVAPGRQGQEAGRGADRQPGQGADQGRHHLGRHDPQGRDVHRGDRARRRRRGDPQRQDAAFGPAGAVHASWCRHADRAVRVRDAGYEIRLDRGASVQLP
jgi:acetylglutamate kinase